MNNADSSKDSSGEFDDAMATQKSAVNVKHLSARTLCGVIGATNIRFKYISKAL